MLLRSILPLLWLTGCVSSFVSSAPVVPLHSKRNDVSASATVRPFFPGLGVHANAAWSPADKVVITTSGTLTHYHDDTERETLGAPSHPYETTRKTIPEHTVQTHSRSMQAELGAGRSFAWHFHRVELLGGGGGGTVDVADDQSLDSDSSYWMESKGTFTRGYAQAHYGLQLHFAELAGGTRVSLTRYQVDEVFSKPTDRIAWIPAVEPFVTVRVGNDWIKGQAMLVVPISFDTQSTGDGHGESIDPIQLPYLVVGLRVNSPDMWRGRSRE